MRFNDLPDIKQVTQYVDDINPESYLLEIDECPDADDNVNQHIYTPQVLEKDSNLFIDYLLQLQFKGNYEFDHMWSILMTMMNEKRDKGELSYFRADFDYDNLVEKFHHKNIGRSTERLIQDDAKRVKLDNLLACMKLIGKIKDYVFVCNYDSRIVSVDDSTNDPLDTLVNYFSTFVERYHLNYVDYLEAVKKKVRTLRTHLITGTAGKQLDDSKAHNSLFLKLATFGQYDFDRSLSEWKIEQKLREHVTYLHNVRQDWHCFYVQTHTTNYLSISYLDFQQIFKCLDFITNTMLRDYSLDRSKLTDYLNDAFKAKKSSNWFYPSKVWSSFDNALQAEEVMDLDDYDSRVNFEIEPELKTVNGIINYLAANGKIKTQNVYSSHAYKSMMPLLYGLLGTLLSIYPEHANEIKDWGNIIFDEVY